MAIKSLRIRMILTTPGHPTMAMSTIDAQTPASEEAPRIKPKKLGKAIQELLDKGWEAGIRPDNAAMVLIFD